MQRRPFLATLGATAAAMTTGASAQEPAGKKLGWALVGLREALRGQGKPTRDVDEQLRASWVRADVKITASRF